MTGRQRCTRSGTDPPQGLQRQGRAPDPPGAGGRLERTKGDSDKLPCRNMYAVTGNGRRNMTVAESKCLKKGSRVYWRGDADDSGRITEISWDAVTIAWDNGQVATVHHGDMREIQRVPTRRATV